MVAQFKCGVLRQVDIVVSDEKTDFVPFVLVVKLKMMLTF